MAPWKRRSLLETIIFRFYVKLQGYNWMISIHPPSSKLLAIRPAEKWLVTFTAETSERLPLWKRNNISKNQPFCMRHSWFFWGGGVVFCLSWEFQKFLDFWFLEIKGKMVSRSLSSLHTISVPLVLFFCSELRGGRKTLNEYRIPSLKLTVRPPRK